MAEEAHIDPKAEASRIAGRYLTELELNRRNKSYLTTRRIEPARDKETDIRSAEGLELAVDERFGAELDVWRRQNTPLAKRVLEEIVKMLKNRTDLSYFGRRMITRIHDQLIKENES